MKKWQRVALTAALTAATAGSVCTKSPRDPNRTIKNLGRAASDIRCFR